MFTRISAFLSTFILFRRDSITLRITISLSAILAVYVVLIDPTKQASTDVLSIPIFIQMLYQVFIGFISALILNIIFEVFVALGQIIATEIGLSIASLMDPRFGGITSLTHFYVITTSLIFLLLNGHLFALKAIVDSFVALPLYHTFVPKTLITDILTYSSIIFSSSVLLSITIIMTVLLTNISLAVMTKFAPQFNLFSIGINITLIIGLFSLYLTFDVLVEKTMVLIQEGLQFLTLTLAKIKAHG